MRFKNPCLRFFLITEGWYVRLVARSHAPPAPPQGGASTSPPVSPSEIGGPSGKGGSRAGAHRGGRPAQPKRDKAAPGAPGGKMKRFGEEAPRKEKQETGKNCCPWGCGRWETSDVNRRRRGANICGPKEKHDLSGSSTIVQLLDSIERETSSLVVA